MRRRTRGFTLVETLVALLIVALLTAALMTGVAVAAGVYSDARFASESGMLANTVNTALGDILHFSTCQRDGENVSFTNRSYGITAGHFLLRDGQLLLSPTETEEEDALLSLISSGAYTDLQITQFSLSYDETTALFAGSYTISGTARQNTEISFVFRSLNGEPNEEP